MIIRLTIRKVLCLCVLCGVGTVNSSMRGLKLYFGLFGGAGFAWQKVKTKGTLPSKNNKFRNSDGLAAWSKVAKKGDWSEGHSKRVKAEKDAAKHLGQLLNGTTLDDVTKAFKSFWRALGTTKTDVELNSLALDTSAADNELIDAINADIKTSYELRITEDQKKFKDNLIESTAKKEYFQVQGSGENKSVVLNDPTLTGSDLDKQIKLMQRNASIAMDEYSLKTQHEAIGKIIKSPDQTLLKKGLSDLDALAQTPGWDEENLLCEEFDGVYEPQPTNFFRSMDLSANLMAMFDMTEMFKVGVSLSVGYSFRELELKETPITINESLMAKIALVLGVTEYVQLHLGVGLVKREVGIKKYEDWDSDYGSAKNLVNNPIIKRFGAGDTNQGIDPDDTCEHIAIYGFGSVVFMIPIDENFSFCASIGVQRDINDFNGDLGGVGPNLEMAPMAYGTFGVGILFKA